jgi:4-diphosphocytidyl-2-C-methyl-D-erythritol kinase
MVFLHNNQKKMVTFPSCKINIGLNITSRRIDGYHDIETIFYPVKLCDALEFVISDRQEGIDNLIVTGISTGCKTENNIVLKAAKKLREMFDIPYLKIHLHKAIPPGAGLGGGSADAAYFVRGITRYFDLNIPAQQAKDILLELGSDCPFFLEAKPSFATGRGEILTPVSEVIKNHYLVLLNPGVGISTRDAYLSCTPSVPDIRLPEIINNPISSWKDLIINDFEEFAINRHPVIGKLKEELYSQGALFSLMSGSGSSVFGIFNEKPLLGYTLRQYIIWEGMM